MSIDYYYLKEKKPIKCKSLEEYFDNIGMMGTKVRSDSVGQVSISTVFLAIDHSFGRHKEPLLFETMVFGGEFDLYQERCATWSEALIMHQGVVEKVKEGLSVQTKTQNG